MGYPTTVDTGGVSPWLIDAGNIAIGNSNAVLSANTVYLWAFELQASAVITGMRWRVAATATGNTDAGIYDSGGNLLAHTGATANSANVQNSANFANALSLPPGKYYMAICPSNATDTYNRVNNIQVGSGSIIERNLTATNNGSAGVLPSTLGGVSAASNMPTMSAIVSGGLA